ARDASNSEYLISQAALEEDQGNFRRAADLYKSASDAKPGSGSIYLKRASALRKANALSDAVASCDAAIGIPSSAAEGYVCRAEAYVRMGQATKAVPDLQEAIRLNPAVPQGADLLGVVRQLLEVSQAANSLSTPVLSAPPASNTPTATVPPPA